MKKDRIIEAALELFAEYGIRSTSTKCIAEKAEVSEGLIYKHFGTKDGLISEIKDSGNELISNLITKVVTQTDSKRVIIEVIDAVKDIEINTQFWKFMYKLKWANGSQVEVKSVFNFVFPHLEALGYENPKQECIFLFTALDGICNRYFMQNDSHLDGQLLILKRKYNLV